MLQSSLHSTNGECSARDREPCRKPLIHTCTFQAPPFQVNTHQYRVVRPTPDVSAPRLLERKMVKEQEEKNRERASNAYRFPSKEVAKTVLPSGVTAGEDSIERLATNVHSELPSLVETA